MKAVFILGAVLILLVPGLGKAQFTYPGKAPGKASVVSGGGMISIENDILRIKLSAEKDVLKIESFEDLQCGRKLNVFSLPLFEIKLNDGSILSSDSFTIRGKVVTGNADTDMASAVFAESITGRKISADLAEKRSGIALHWEAELRDGSNYVKQEFRFKVNGDSEILEAALIKLPSSSGAEKIGLVDGSPLLAGTMFFALEYPLSVIAEENDNVTIYVSGITECLSTAWGVLPDGQLRRGFLYYVERERAHPYHQNLHYNSWFDISWHDRIFDEKISLDRIKLFGDSLVRARKVPMDGYLFDDGWDDHRTLWKFHSGFPDGFANLGRAVKEYDSEIGVWMSPFGGYGKTKEQRLEYGRKQNPPFETNRNGFSLSGPVYYKRFMEVAGDFIRNYGIFMFKFDGVGAGIGAGSGDLIEYRQDVESFLTLLDDLLDLRPDLYLSLTTGTWPSVYWLNYGDNIWRGGDDTNMTGEGSKRQQWITYRDADVYSNIVKRGPLFPLNSLMTCGICIADNGNPAVFEMNEKDISDEIWSFFATGTNLQELYINPHKLSKENWDCLASAALWAKENEAVLRDVHWIGGDPSKEDVYGYAAWNEREGVVSLRNPSSAEKSFNLSVREVFELPAGESDNYIFTDAIAEAAGREQIVAEGHAFMIVLKPFELRVFNAVRKY